MMAGSGINAKPSDAIEESIEGLSLKVKSTASRAPPAWSNADTMARAVCGNSRSAVIWGPRSDRASTVRSSRRKLFFCTATHGCGQRPEQKKSNMRRNSGIRSLLVSLVLRKQPSACSLQLSAKKPCHPDRNQAKGRDLVFPTSLPPSHAGYQKCVCNSENLSTTSNCRGGSADSTSSCSSTHVAPCGTNTAFNPAARAGLISDLGLLPIIQVASGSSSYLEITER